MSLVEQLKTLGDESRLRILILLSSGMYSVQELTSILNLSQPTVSHHLKNLSNNGFTQVFKNGTHNYYTLADSDKDSSLASLLQAVLFSLNNKLEDSLTTQIDKDRLQARNIVKRRTLKTKDYFNSVAPEWSKIRNEGPGQENFLELVADRIPDTDTFLDLGCGSGALLNVLLPRSGETIGVDYSEGMLDEAKSNLAERAKGVDLRLGYIEHLPVADESIDCAVCYMVLHHTANPVEALKDIQRVLRPGGSCIIVDLLEHKNEVMRSKYADVWLGFAPTQVQDWLSSQGFIDIKVEELGNLKEVFLMQFSKLDC